MNENSYLNPTKMKEQCDSAIQKLENDNEAIRVAENSLNTFLNDSEIKSEAFDALKFQMSDYITVLQAMRTANNSDIADFATLKSAVGDEVLIGSNILEQKAAALRQKQQMRILHSIMKEKPRKPSGHGKVGIITGKQINTGIWRKLTKGCISCGRKKKTVMMK